MVMAQLRKMMLLAGVFFLVEWYRREKGKKKDRL